MSFSPSMARDKLLDILRRDEGTGPVIQGRFYPYVDCCGKQWKLCKCREKGNLTIGRGHNLDAKGLTLKQVEGILNDDVDDAIKDCAARYPWYETLDVVRQAVMTALMFNMGPKALATFTNFLAYAKAGDAERAAVELLDSDRAVQVGDRALREAEMYRTGRWV